MQGDLDELPYSQLVTLESRCHLNKTNPSFSSLCAQERRLMFSEWLTSGHPTRCLGGFVIAGRHNLPSLMFWLELSLHVLAERAADVEHLYGNTLIMFFVFLLHFGIELQFELAAD